MSALPVAVLPMYDRPEIRAGTDRLWAAIRDRLRTAGMAAPDALDRTMPVWQAWTDPDLALGQTCGLPYATRLDGRVGLVGAPDFGVGGCPPGHYCSVLVVRADDPRDRLEAFRGAVAAVNETGSQSGHAALMDATAPLARDGGFLGGAWITGSHASSIRAVAEGAADLAAIDAQYRRITDALARGEQLLLIERAEFHAGLEAAMRGEAIQWGIRGAFAGEPFEVEETLDFSNVGSGAAGLVTALLQR